MARASGFQCIRFVSAVVTIVVDEDAVEFWEDKEVSKVVPVGDEDEVSDDPAEVIPPPIAGMIEFSG